MGCRLGSGRDDGAVLEGLKYPLVPTSNQCISGIEHLVKDDGGVPRHGTLGALEAPEM
ncbi:hypothetical protein ACFV2E_13230 [Streptomyces globisporus]|uniref:hypothetical protein n=1 Tax=Streptomyces globisporus TaxID=1908 RepID=UPI003685D0B7